jgi:SAM-dependent methyltransferase
MRRWDKYSRDLAFSGVKRVGADADFGDHSKAMGDYAADVAYADKAAFFAKHYRGVHFGRLENYDDFLRGRLRKDDRVLSVASGRSVNELRLREEGYRIVCSDLDLPNSYQATKALFPDCEFLKLDILKGSASAEYDAVIALSLIYLFDDVSLDAFFGNVAASLRPGGRLLLDSAGAPDNIPAFLWFDVWLKCEVYLLRFAKRLLGRGCDGIVIKRFGYRRTDGEIAAAARRRGLELVSRKAYASITDFVRSHLFYILFLRRAMRPGSPANRFFTWLGGFMPYTRMFEFRKGA